MFATLAMIGALLAHPAPEYRIVPGRSIGRTVLGQRSETLARLGTPRSGDAAMGKAWSTWISPRGGRLDVYTALGADGPIIRIVRVTSSAFRTNSGLGAGISESRMRRAFPRARDKGTYLPAEGGPPVHLFDDLRGGFSFEVQRGVCIAVAVHSRGRGIEDSGMPLRIYLHQPLTDN